MKYGARRLNIKMIHLTQLASEKVKAFLEKRGKGLGIKVGVRTTGCSGLAYLLEFVDNELPMAEYDKFENGDIKVWVDKKCIPYVNGLTMDWQKKGLNEGFEFINPNEATRCGCGESFTV
jgi:iron-sulfur cluster assembly protein